MRLVAVCESPPSVDPASANGSTLISHHVLSRLPFPTRLRWFAEPPAPASGEVLGNAVDAAPLPLRPAAAALAAQPVTSLPRASWRRDGAAARAAVAELTGDADLLYLHGLHAFPLAAAARCPVVVNEVDPWSSFWAERAAQRSNPLLAAYDRDQARRARRLERRTSARAARYIVVNAGDAVELERALGRAVDVLPNGADLRGTAPDVERRPLRLVFGGTLDYAPNVEAAQRLVERILPPVLAAEPDVEVVRAGRRPSADVRRLAGPQVRIAADVPDLVAELATGAVAVYAGTGGRGMKNSLLEAMAAGCAVVVHRGSARGVPIDAPLDVVEDDGAMVARIVAHLRDPDAAAALGEQARAFALAWPTWDEVADRYRALFEAAAG